MPEQITLQKRVLCYLIWSHLTCHLKKNKSRLCCRCLARCTQPSSLWGNMKGCSQHSVSAWRSTGYQNEGRVQWPVVNSAAPHSPPRYSTAHDMKQLLPQNVCTGPFHFKYMEGFVQLCLGLEALKILVCQNGFVAEVHGCRRVPTEINHHITFTIIQGCLLVYPVEQHGALSRKDKRGLQPSEKLSLCRPIWPQLHVRSRKDSGSRPPVKGQHLCNFIANHQTVNVLI